MTTPATKTQADTNNRNGRTGQPTTTKPVSGKITPPKPGTQAVAKPASKTVAKRPPAAQAASKAAPKPKAVPAPRTAATPREKYAKSATPTTAVAEFFAWSEANGVKLTAAQQQAASYTLKVYTTFQAEAKAKGNPRAKSAK